MGSISGGSGALLLECHRRGIPSMALLAETVGNRPDPRSASFLLERVSALIGREVDTSSLVQEADQLESTLATLSRDVEKQSKREEFDSMYM
jgi:predicted ATP-grasp superfamily ATP-dependent carboligase